MESGRSNGSSTRGVTGGKKMRKRKELDALVGGVGVKRGGGGSKRPGSGGVSPQDQLLSESTGEEDYWSSKTSGKSKRHYSSSGVKRGSNTCSALLRLCTILLIMACVVATITVMWLFIDIREQTTHLGKQLDKVAAGSQGVSADFQKCHSLSRQLQNNQTQIFSQMAVMAQQLSNFSALIGIIQGSLNSVETKLQRAPGVVNMQDEHLQALSSSIAHYGSDIQDLQSTTTHISEEQKRFLGDLEIIKKNVTTFGGLLKKIKEPVNPIAYLSNSTDNGISIQEKFMNVLMDKFRPNITSINETLSHRLDWVSEDQHKDYKLIEMLQEVSANMSSQLMSLQRDFAQLATNYSTINSQIKIMDDLVRINSHQNTEKPVANISKSEPEPAREDIYNKLSNNSSTQKNE